MRLSGTLRPTERMLRLSGTLRPTERMVRLERDASPYLDRGYFWAQKSKTKTSARTDPRLAAKALWSGWTR